MTCTANYTVDPSRPRRRPGHQHRLRRRESPADGTPIAGVVSNQVIISIPPTTGDTATTTTAVLEPAATTTTTTVAAQLPTTGSNTRSTLRVVLALVLIGGALVTIARRGGPHRPADRPGLHAHLNGGR